MSPSSRETIGSSSDTIRGAVDGETSWPSVESIDTSSVERYRGNTGSQCQPRDENYLLVSEAIRARRDQELSSTFDRGFSSPSTVPRLQDEGPHFSLSKDTSPGSWGLSDGWRDYSPFERKVDEDSLNQSRNPFETLPDSPTPSRQRSNSYKSLGSPGSGDFSPGCGDRKNLLLGTPRQTPGRLTTRPVSHLNMFRQAPMDIPNKKHTSESPESPGGDVFHFSPEGDSYSSLVANNLIHTRGSQFNESPSMQRKQQLNAILHNDCKILASTRDGFEGYGSPNFADLEGPFSSPPGPLTGPRGLITSSRRKNWEPRYRQRSSTTESSSTSRQDLASGTVLSGRHSKFGSYPRLPGSSALPKKNYQEDVKNLRPSMGSTIAKLYTSMDLLDDPSEEKEAFTANPTSIKGSDLCSSLCGGNATMLGRASVKAHNHLQPGEPECRGTIPELQASPQALSLEKGKLYPSLNTERSISSSNNTIVGEFLPNFVDKTEKHANLRREIEGILNEPENRRVRGSPLVARPDMGAENPTLTASLASASSGALQGVLDFLTAQVKALLQGNSARENIWSKHFPVTDAGSIQYLPKDTKAYAFENCSNFQKLIRCTAVFFDTLTGTSNSGFWVEPGLFITSLRFRDRSASGHVIDFDPDMTLENARYFVSPSNTGMLEDRIPVFLKAWDTRSSLAIFQPASGGLSQKYRYEHIGIKNLVEDHELLPTYRNQICSSDNIVAVGYIHARPQTQEEREPDDLTHKTGYLRLNRGRGTRIRTVCSINQVRRFIEANEHSGGVLKADCLFPQNFYGSPCIIKQSGLVIGVVNGPHNVSNTGDIRLFPREFRARLRWYL